MARRQEGEIRLWDIKSRELVSNLKEHNSRVSGLALCNDHVHALSCSRDRSIFVWDLRSGPSRHSFVSSGDWSPRRTMDRPNCTKAVRLSLRNSDFLHGYQPRQVRAHVFTPRPFR